MFEPLEIVLIESFATRQVGFVRVTDAEGAQGWGQVSTYHSDIAAEVLHRQVAPWVLGRPTDDLDDLEDIVTEREHKFPGAYLRRALGGFDTAVWDLRSKRLERPVAALLGGSAGRVRAYASSMRRDISPADEVERLRRLAGEHGFTAFKVRAGREVGRGADAWPGRTEELIAAMSRAFPDADLLIDANSCYAPADAVGLGRRLEDAGFCHFEEPCPYWELEQTAEVTAALDIDVSGGEQDTELPTWRRMIEMRAVDIPQPDICYVGGLSRALRVARMAEAAGLPVTPHAANLSMVTLFTMHMLRAVPNPGRYLEFSIEGSDYYPWQEGLFARSPFAVADGHATVTDVPGWGVDVAPEWLAKASYRRSDLEDARHDW